ncbi:MAG: hypothetical protein AAF669_09215 [Pseudomonadota bacterium]
MTTETDTLQPVVIRDQFQVYDLLERYMTNPLEIADLNLSYDGWPSLRIHLEGPAFDQTITPAMMKGFLQVQQSIYELYARHHYGAGDARRLSRKERQALEISVRVESGSSNFVVDFQGVLSEFMAKAVDKMTGKQLTLSVISLITAYFGHSAFTHHLDDLKHQRLIEMQAAQQKTQLAQMQFMTEQDKKHQQIMARLSAAHPEWHLDTAAEMRKPFYDTLMKGMATAETASFQGVAIAPEVAKTLLSTPREAAKVIRLDGEFRILQVDSSDPTQFKVKVQNQKNGEELEAIVQDDSLDQHNRTILQTAEWLRQPVSLKINARQLRGKYKDATILEVARVD